MNRRRIVVAHFVALSLGVSILTAQAKQADVRIVPGAPVCAKCRITLTKEWSFSEESGELLPKYPSRVVVDSKGRVIVARSEQGPPIVFDSRGRHIKTLGAKGDGPGESRSVVHVLLAEGDTIITLDFMLARMTVFSPEGRNVRQSVLLNNGMFSAAWSPSGTTIIQTSVHDRARFGKALHTYDRVGNYVRSFGVAGGGVLGRIPGNAWHVGPAGRSAVWMMPSYGAFVIEKWSLTGERASAWSIQLPWFPRDTAHRYFKPDGPDPTPYLRGVAEGPDNQLWILAGVVDPNWRKAVTGWRRFEGVSVPDFGDLGKAWDTMVVVVDSRTGRVQAVRRFDESFGFAGPGRVMRYFTDDNGKATLEIHRLALVQPPGG